MHPFVPKTRRPKFDLTLKIIDLNNVPLVSGTSFIKWHLPHSTAAEHRGRTPKCHIKDHKVDYDYEKQLSVKLTVDRNRNLVESAINFEVIQEYSSGARGERIALGNVRLNLAEYVEASELEGEDGVCRRYLMQDSKINSTLKIAIRMTLVDGDRNFNAPFLKSAPVFGGIAGIIAGENGETEENGHMPSLSNKSRETGEIQDMYRRNLAAYWTAQPGELRADECIENIFAGGDGWESSKTTNTNNNNKNDHISGDHTPPGRMRSTRSTRDKDKDGDAHGSRSSVKWGSGKGWFGGEKVRDHAKHAHNHDPRRSSHEGRGEDAVGRGGLGGDRSGSHGRSSLERQAEKQHQGDHTTANEEVDEFTVRDDLRSWKVGDGS